MLKECTMTGRTVEEAIDAGCRELGIDRDVIDVDYYEIISLPKKGFFGLMSQPAKVRVWVEEAEPVVSKAKAAADYLDSILKEMGLNDVTIDIKEEDGNAVLTLSGKGLGVIIGRRGETLDALQYLAGLVANRLEGDYMRITIDSGNYREKREKTLEALARKLANNAVKTGRSSTLEPMNPYERRIIHAAVATVEGAASTSIGEEPNRRVVISSTAPRKPRERSEGSRGDRRNSRGRRPNGGSRGPRPERRDNRDGSFAEKAPRTEHTGGVPVSVDATLTLPENPVHSAPAAPAQQAPVKRTAPAEAEGQPLYGKIEL